METSSLDELKTILHRWREAQTKGGAVSLQEYCKEQQEYYPSLRFMVEFLKEFDERPGAGSSTPGGGSTQGFEIDADAEAPATLPLVPGYEILGVLGQGGMGVVYHARQLDLNRVVALKMILAGPQASSMARRRFRQEAETIAQLGHANIVQIYDIGEWQQLPYIALEYCPGGSLWDMLSAGPLEPRRTAALVEKLALAMHGAHEKGIIHRDLKPANVLFDAAGEPKVSDFGLARKIDDAGMTHTGAIVGTPSYMAPEQASGTVRALTPACDVYALGALIYRCLTGRPPFQAASSAEVIVQVLNDEPKRPRSLVATVPRDLETICLKCLHKDPPKRYRAAADLAEDLRRFQAGEPIRAKAVGKTERLLKWSRRHPTQTMLGSSLALAALVIGALFVHVRLQSSEQQAIKERAAWIAYANQLEQAHAAWQNNDLVTASNLLDACPQALRGWEHDYLTTLFYHVGQRTVTKHEGGVRSVCYSPNGTRLASAGNDGKIRIIDATNGKEIRTLEIHQGPVYSVCFHPDGTRLASGGHDGTIKISDVDSGETLEVYRGHAKPVRKVAFNHDGRRLVSGDEAGNIVVRDEMGRVLFSSRPLNDHVNDICFVANSPYVAFTAEGKCKVLHPESGEEVYTASARRASFSPDGSRLALGGVDGKITIYSVPHWQELTTFFGNPTTSLCWTTDGKGLACGSSSGVLQIWDSVKGVLLHSLKAHNKPLNEVRFSPDNTRLLSAGADGAVKLWDVEHGQTETPFLLKSKKSLDVFFSSYCAPWLAVNNVSSFDLFELPTGKQLSTPPHEGFGRATFSADGSQLIITSDTQVTVWDREKGQVLLQIPRKEQVHTVRLSPDGKLLAGHGHQIAMLWNAATGEVVCRCPGHVGQVFALDFSRDGRRFATGGEDTTIKIWDTRTGKELHTLRGHDKAVRGVCFLGDNQRLASASLDGTARIWDSASGRELIKLQAHRGEVFDICTSTEGNRVFTAGGDGTIRIFEPTYGTELFCLRKHSKFVTSLHLSADNTTLVSLSTDRTVRTWSATRRDSLSWTHK